ncbi:MAG: hypothetical protein L3V56_09340 [Candidatus Magnetoovum sp. WYHC-5]|nr:hypothetical protein [Candidatus Magnetoovum sp. WYHC-5]
MSILRHLTVLNIILGVVCGSLGYYGYGLYKKEIKIEISDDNSSKVMMDVINVSGRKKLQSNGDYIVVTEKNLFHPDRKYEKPVPVETPKPKPPPPDFMVYGTLITNEGKIAFVENKKTPFTSPGRGKRQSIVHIGEPLNEYILQEVNEGDVVFVNGEDRYTFKIMSDEKNAQRKAVTSGDKDTGKGTKEGQGGSNSKIKKAGDLEQKIFSKRPPVPN